MTDAALPEAVRELRLDLTLAAPRSKLWRCWTEPDLMVQWFTPHPWSTARAELDVRPGGSSFVVMRSPEGEEFPNRGVYLEVLPERKLVFTDAYVSAWTPAEKPFMTAIVTFADAGQGQTAYVARALHWTAEDCAAHAAMGFHDGWTRAARQLEAVASCIP